MAIRPLFKMVGSQKMNDEPKSLHGKIAVSSNISVKFKKMACLEYFGANDLIHEA